MFENLLDDNTRDGKIQWADWVRRRIEMKIHSENITSADIVRNIDHCEKPENARGGQGNK